MPESIPPDEYLLRELGSFNPITFDLKVESDGAREPGGAEARTYFHEFVHLLQSLGSTYCVDHHLETMNYIAAAVADMGGRADLVLSGGSDAEVTADSIKGQLGFRYQSLEGAYGSRRVDLGLTLPEGHETLGMCRFNEERLCWEYVRWNEREGCFFATPIGAVTLRETQAYVLQHLVEIESSAEVAIAYETEAPSGSGAHVYTAVSELFFRTFNDQEVPPDDKLATLIILVDMALQIPPTSYRGHTDWTPMSIPGLRFMTFFEHVREVGFVDHRDDADYLRFTEEMCDLIGWPTPRAIWEEFVQEVEGMLKPIRRLVRASIDADPAAFERFLDRYFAANLFSIGGRAAIAPPEVAAVAAEVERIKAAFRENPLSYSGYLGVGVLDAFGRALKLRLEQPIAFVFPQQQDFMDLLHARVKPPVLHYGGVMYPDHSAVSLPLLEDIQGIRHLWAITLQWAAGRDRDILCGNQVFGLACPHPSCREALCPAWSPGVAYPATCTYADVLRYYELNSTEGD